MEKNINEIRRRKFLIFSRIDGDFPFSCNKEFKLACSFLSYLLHVLIWMHQLLEQIVCCFLMIFLLYNNYQKWYFHMYTLYNICLTNIKWVSCILVYQTNILCILSFNLMLGLHSLYLLVTCSCVWIYFLYLFSSILNKLSLWILLRPPPFFYSTASDGNIVMHWRHLKGIRQ